MRRDGAVDPVVTSLLVLTLDPVVIPLLVLTLDPVVIPLLVLILVSAAWPRGAYFLRSVEDLPNPKPGGFAAPR